MIKDLCHKTKYFITLIIEVSQVWSYLHKKDETYFSSWIQHSNHHYCLVIAEQGVDELFSNSPDRDHILLSPYGPLAFLQEQNGFSWFTPEECYEKAWIWY